MIGHLGSRVSALLDGRLSEAEEERAWDHVHGCHACRDLVEREGWVKTQLAGLRPQSECRASESFKSTLSGAHFAELTATLACAEQQPAFVQRHRGVLVLGSSAAGMAFLGVAALGGVFGTGTTIDRRPPSMTNIDQPVSGLSASPQARPTRRSPSGVAPVSTRTPAAGATQATRSGVAADRRAGVAVARVADGMGFAGVVGAAAVSSATTHTAR